MGLVWHWQLAVGMLAAVFGPVAVQHHLHATRSRGAARAGPELATDRRSSDERAEAVYPAVCGLPVRAGRPVLPPDLFLAPDRPAVHRDVHGAVG